MAIARARFWQGIDFEHSDHLGSPVAQTYFGHGSLKSHTRYSPFGIAMDDPDHLKDQGGFTGHIKDSATGLNPCIFRSENCTVQARYYDPVIGRFLSVDPVTFLSGGGNPGYFNRYAYTFNNPINAIDPDGSRVRPPPRYHHPMRGHNRPPKYQPSLPMLETVRAINPRVQIPTRANFDREEFSSNMLQNYDFFGRGNIDGSNTSTIYDWSAGASVQNVLANSFDRHLKPNATQFRKNGGLQELAHDFAAVTGQNFEGIGSRADFFFGATSVNVHVHRSSNSHGTQSPTISITATTRQLGSKMKTKHTVKVRYEEANK